MGGGAAAGALKVLSGTLGRGRVGGRGVLGRGRASWGQEGRASGSQSPDLAASSLVLPKILSVSLHFTEAWGPLPGRQMGW